MHFTLNILHNIRKTISNIPGWRTDRRIVVIESDDWGSIRMPSIQTFIKLENAGLDLRSLDAERYNLNDTLATPSDLQNLFEILNSFRDRFSNNAVFTALSVVANPDFNKIKETNFKTYYYEPFTETLKRYHGNDKTFELWIEGINKKIFIPQLHGREHLNVQTWLRLLKSGEKQTKLAFEEGFWGFVPERNSIHKTDFQAAFLLSELSELEYHKQVIIEATSIFKKLLGYKAEYFVPPNGPINNNLNLTLFENGIKYRSASKVQYEPVGKNKTKKVINWLGKKEKNGIIYITRNCFFEPSLRDRDWVDTCLNDIKIAFRLDKPAIISSHRVNYVGDINLNNRDLGLSKLKILLQAILRNWPDVQFLTTPDLGKLIEIDLL